MNSAIVEPEHSHGVMPPEIRHEAMPLLTEAYAACEAAQIAIAKARAIGVWGIEASEFRLECDKALVRASAEITSLQLRAATTQRGTAL